MKIKCLEVLGLWDIGDTVLGNVSNGLNTAAKDTTGWGRLSFLGGSFAARFRFLGAFHYKNESFAVYWPARPSR